MTERWMKFQRVEVRGVQTWSNFRMHHMVIQWRNGGESGVEWTCPEVLYRMMGSKGIFNVH